MRESYTQRIKVQKEREKNKFSFDDGRYLRSRKMAASGPLPFKFNQSKLKSNAKAPR